MILIIGRGGEFHTDIEDMMYGSAIVILLMKYTEQLWEFISRRAMDV
ncbi:MAG: hypothetical protein ACTSQZ_08040 [Candidatus Thorarchaeota archaeon]